MEAAPKPKEPQHELNDILKAANGQGGPSVLQVISERFVEASQLNRAEAWRQLQRDIMLAAPVICPVIIPYKDLLSAVADIEGKIKGTTGQAGRSNEELLADYLNGGSAVAVTSTPPGEPVIDSILIEPLQPNTLSTDATIYTSPLTSQPSPT